MALKPDRYEFQTEIHNFCDTVTERGVVLVYKQGKTGRGVAVDDKNSVVTLATAPSGQSVAGILLNDVIATDPSLNVAGRLKDQVQVNAKCTLLRKGYVTTNMVDSATGVVPVAGKPAYLGASGLLTDVFVNAVASPKVGTFLSSKDAKNFVKVEVLL